MRLLYRITDRDVRGGEPDLLPHVSRSASRGVLLDADANVAMMHIAKSAIYKLPGGGIEKKETPEQAFLREVREETGYDAAIVRRLGYIEEHKKKNGFLQVSYCFVATAKEAHEARLTEHEKKLGLSLKWMSMPQAVRAVEASLTATGDYSTVFMLMRDKRILEEAAKRMRMPVTE